MSSQATAIQYERVAPHIFQTLGSVHQLMAKQGFSPITIHLVELRASQMNKCAYCIKMHTKEARDDGESNERLERVIVWRHVDDFTPGEKAALAWTEALTDLKDTTDYGALRAELKEYYSDEDIAVLTTAVAMINLWNRVQISKH